MEHNTWITVSNPLTLDEVYYAECECGWLSIPYSKIGYAREAAWAHNPKRLPS